MATPTQTQKAAKVAVYVLKGDVLVERGEFWPNGAGLSIAIEDADLRAQVEGGVRTCLSDVAITSVELECGWTVAILRKGVA